MKRRIFLFLTLFVLRGPLQAQDENCPAVASIARMARAKSASDLAEWRRRAGDSYRAKVVFQARLLELNPKSKSAADSLLELIPKNQEQKLVLVTLGDSLCGSEAMRDMTSLDRLGERLSSDLARAVLLVPEKMQSYVFYASAAVRDPHSDYAVQMQGVCRGNHESFTKVVEEMPEGDRDWFVKHILDPNTCHAFALPEAD
ncbi:MAG: hypothetical protein ABSF28_21385 [Terracidiphilus sp.]|jgi:hypothetical protein